MEAVSPHSKLTEEEYLQFNGFIKDQINLSMDERNQKLRDKANKSFSELLRNRIDRIMEMVPGDEDG